MSKRITVYLLSPADRPHYKAEWIEPGTRICRSRTTRTADPHEAERFRADLEYELNNGLAERFTPLPWAEFVERYFAERLDGRKDRTGEKARCVFRIFAGIASPATIQDVDAGMVSRYAAARRKEGRAPATIAGDLAYLGASLRWAARHGLRGPAPHIDLPSVPKRRRFRTLPEADYPRAMAALPGGPWRLLLQVAWYTGMRRNEMLAMGWEESDRAPWLDLDAARIWIPGPAAKSGREDWLPIHPKLGEALGGESREGKVIKLGVGPKTASDRFIGYMQAAGLKIKLHDIRRSFGTRYASVVPAQVLQRLMRHANIKTTMEFYADLDDTLAGAIARLE